VLAVSVIWVASTRSSAGSIPPDLPVSRPLLVPFADRRIAIVRLLLYTRVSSA
jgi:hypothetical protein